LISLTTGVSSENAALIPSAPAAMASTGPTMAAKIAGSATTAPAINGSRAMIAVSINRKRPTRPAARSPTASSTASAVTAATPRSAAI